MSVNYVDPSSIDSLSPIAEILINIINDILVTVTKIGVF